MNINNKSHLWSFPLNIQLFAVLFIGLSIPLSPTLTDISFIFGSLVSLATCSWRRFIPQLIHWWGPLLAIFLFSLFLIGLFYSPSPWHDRFEILGKYSKVVLGVIMIPLFANEFLRRVSFRAFTTAIILTLMLSLALYFQLLPSNDHFLAEAVFRDHIVQNLMMSVFAYFVLLEIVQAEKWRWFWIVLLIITLHQIFFISGGRTGYFTFFATLLLFAWQHFYWRGIVLGFLAILIFSPVVYYLSPMLQDRVHFVISDLKNHQKGNDATSLGLRMVYAKSAMSLIKESPVYGHGTGSYKYLYQTQFLNKTKLESFNPHNEYLHLGVQFGLLGTLTFILWLLYSWVESYKLSDWPRKVLQGLVVTFAIGCLANSWLMDTTPGHLLIFWWMWAYSAAFGEAN